MMDAMTIINKISAFPLVSFPSKHLQRPAATTPRTNTFHSHNLTPTPTIPNERLTTTTTTTLEETKQVHAHLLKTQFGHDLPLPTTDHQTHSSPAANLNSLITSYIKNARPYDALKIYAEVRWSGAWLDNFTLPSVLKACGKQSGLRHGREVHGYAVKAGLVWDVFVQNSLMQMYSECRTVELARRVFDEMPDRDTVSWSTMIHSYSRNRCFKEALHIIRRMLLLQLQPSEVAMLNMLNLFADVAVLMIGKSMHAYLIKNNGDGPISVALNTALIDMYVKCGNSDAARRIFSQMSQKSIATWTSMVAGHIRCEELGEGSELLGEMLEENVMPNEITMLSLLIVCGTVGALELGEWLHAYMLKNGFPMSMVLGTALVDMYAKCWEIERARSLFDHMQEKDIRTWTAMISGYAKSGSFSEALLLFGLMKNKKVKPNEITMVTLLSACAEAGALDIGKWLHACVDKEGGKYDLVLTTALIDMYAKCGDIDGAYEIFSAAKSRDICMWNAMISGLALHGNGKEAMELFSRMEKERVEPNHITFVGLLHACSHSGLVAEGKLFFDRMERDFQLTPKVEHYGCMVDLLGRAGFLNEAHEMINNMSMTPNVVVWGALLAGCKLHKNTRLGEEAAGRLMELEPQNCGYNVLLSNIYALENRWGDVAEVRRTINNRGIKKAPGLSSIEVNGSLHEFVMGDDSHPQTKQIHEMVAEMMRELRCAGYMPITSASLLNVDEEEKETALAYHSEKLAIAFGLICTAPSTPIRVVKNLRVCDDCHEATKLLSKIYGRLIIVRDRNRFHHFKEGSCSCGDYW